MSNSPIVRDVLDNGLRLLTERMTQVRSVSIGVWLTRGSRHESAEQQRHRPLRRAHALQGDRHPIGRGHRAGDRLDRRPARRVHGEGVRQLLHQGARRAPAARHRHPRPTSSATRRSAPRTSSARRRSSSKRSRWSRTRPTTSSTSCSRRASGRTIRSAGRFSARARPSSRSTPTLLRDVLPAGVHGAQPDRVGGRQSGARSASANWWRRSSGRLRRPARSPARRRPSVVPEGARSATRSSSRATCASASAAIRRITTTAMPSYVLNTLLGGSMSSRLFQNVREKRGLAYAVFSGLSAYRDAGSFTIYAGCANDAVGRGDRSRGRGAARRQAGAGARRPSCGARRIT